MIAPARRTLFGAACLSLAVAGCNEGPAAPAADLAPSFAVTAPVLISFEKAFTGDFQAGPWQWSGAATVPGVGAVDLYSSIDLSQLRATGQVLHAPVYWLLSGPGFSMEIVTDGIINLQNGAVRTNGRVTDGSHAGAAVHQEGQLTGLDAAGTIRVLPSAVR